MAFIDTTWYVGSVQYAAVTAWATGATIAAGAVRRPTAPAAGNERLFIAIVGGTTHATTEPTWTNTRGAKTTDNTVTWQEATGQASLCGDSTNTTTWTQVKNTVVTLGQIIKNVSGGADTYFIASTGGTAGNGSEPTWNKTAGSTTADNTVTWTSLGAISGFTAFLYPFNRLSDAQASTWSAAGNTQYVSHQHAYSLASGYFLQSAVGTAAAPLKAICVNDSVAPPTTLATTASEITTGANAFTISGGYCHFYGIRFSCGSGATNSNLTLGNSSNAYIFDNCALEKLGTTGSSTAITIGATNGANEYIEFPNCTFKFGSTSDRLNIGTGVISFDGGSIAATGSVPSTALTHNGSRGIVKFRGVDLSALTGTLYNNNGDSPFNFENCKINGSVTIGGASGAVNLGTGQPRLYNSDSANTNYRYLWQTYAGSIVQETTTTRSGGATDGTTALSWKAVSTANSNKSFPFASEEIVIWNDTTGGSKTATIEFTTDTALTNDDMWIQVEYLGNASFPLSSIAKSRNALVGAASNLTTSSATWNSVKANKYSIGVSFTPQQKGPVKVRVMLAKASTTVYIDPVITIT